MVLLSYSIGALLGATFIGILPEASQRAPVNSVLDATLIGLLGFFVLEKILMLPHFHAHDAEHAHYRRGHHEIQPVASLILLGDALHNFVDGVLIASAFLISFPLGVLTSFAVIAHEIPQELGDFVILLESGMERRRAYWVNFAVATTTVPGALLTYGMRNAIDPYVPYILAIAAASFIYIATVDIAPIVHHQRDFRSGFKQIAGLLTGAGTVALIHFILNGH